MAHYALLNDRNIVTQVIVGRDEDDLVEGVTSWEDYYANITGQRVLRTSYNTLAGEHSQGGTPFRGNYAGINYRYDETLDAFIPPKPFNSWVLDETTFQWVAPIPHPEPQGWYSWDELTQQWVKPVPPHASWVWSDVTNTYQPPVARPDDGGDYIWNEETGAWEEIPNA